MAAATSSWGRNPGPKFYKGHKNESPWNNDLHHMKMLENEQHYYKVIDDNTFNPVRQRNPLCLSLKEVVSDESVAKKFAVRQINGIRPTLPEKTELHTGRKCEMTLGMLAETTGMLGAEIPLLAKQVRDTESRIAKIENRYRRRAATAGASRSRGGSGASQSNKGTGPALGFVDRQMYSPPNRPHISPGEGLAGRLTGRSQSALSQRSVISDASSVVEKAQQVLRPSTAKSTKTVLSHRLRNGWSATLRQGDIKRLAGKGIPKRTIPWKNSDTSTGQVRVRPTRPRTCIGGRSSNAEPVGPQRAPGYRAPDLDIIEGGRDP